MVLFWVNQLSGISISSYSPQPFTTTSKPDSTEASSRETVRPETVMTPPLGLLGHLVRDVEVEVLEGAVGEHHLKVHAVVLSARVVRVSGENPGTPNEVTTASTP